VTAVHGVGSEQKKAEIQSSLTKHELFHENEIKAHPGERPAAHSYAWVFARYRPGGDHRCVGTEVNACAKGVGTDETQPLGGSRSIVTKCERAVEEPGHGRRGKERYEAPRIQIDGKDRDHQSQYAGIDATG